MFSKKLRAVRMLRGLTQQKLADAVGLALRSYQCYEQGTREPPLDMLIKLADTLGVSTDYLLCREGVNTMTKAEIIASLWMVTHDMSHNKDMFDYVKQFEFLTKEAQNALDQLNTNHQLGEM